jgi:phosphoesterase RecJ-like protein
MEKEKNEHKQCAKKVFKFIEKNDNFLLSAHINADGDAIASVIATGLFLEKLNKKYCMILHDQNLDTRFNYLKNFDRIIPFKKKLKMVISAAIVLDVPGIKRLGDVANLLPPRSNIVKIDHHPQEDDFADLNFVDKKASSTTRLIYELIEVSKVKIGADIANAIYTGIIYDTGRLSFSNTSAKDLYICAKMIDLGVEPATITNKIFFENSFNALQTIGKGLASMESYLDGAVIVIYLGYKSMSKNHHGEIEELANYSVAIRGGKVGLFIREFKPGFHKISMRSKDDIDVNKIAKLFDGGGHVHASGCRIKGNKEEVIKKLLYEIEKEI